MIEIPAFSIRYFPVPRAANTSITIFLGWLCGVDWREFRKSDWPHPTIAQGVHHEGLWNELLSKSEVASSGQSRQPWFEFTVLRNPITRFISAYHLLLLEKDPHLWATRRPPPEELLISPERLGDRDFVLSQLQDFLRSDYFRALVQEDVHFKPQSQLVPTDRNIEVYHLEEGLTKITRSLLSRVRVVPRTSPPEHVNASVARFFSVLDLSDSDIETLTQVYRHDFSRFSFSKAITCNANADMSASELRLFIALRERNERILELWTSLTNKEP